MVSVVQGPFVAALYHRYSNSNGNGHGHDNSIETLRRIFAQIESHFHGTSSGLDPLVSYLGRGNPHKEKRRRWPCHYSQV